MDLADGDAHASAPRRECCMRRLRMLSGRDVIPVIDLGPYLSGQPGALTSTAAELGRALRDVGFFVLVNHGIPQDLIDRTFAEARRFHASPMDAKLALRMNAHNNGYMMMGHLPRAERRARASGQD